MNRSKEEYLQLIQQTKQYILQEYVALENEGEKNKKWVVSDLETYQVFKDYALKHKKQAGYQATPQILKQPTEALQKFAPKENPISQIEISKPVEIPKIAPKTESLTPLLSVEEQTSKNIFIQEPLKPASLHDLTDIKKHVQQLFPRQLILDNIPSADLEVIIISDHNDKKSELFLSNLAKAIDIRLKTCRILSSKKYFAISNFQKLQMIIRTDSKVPLKEDIKDVELFDIMKFITNPTDKAALWKEIENGLLS